MRRSLGTAAATGIDALGIQDNTGGTMGAVGGSPCCHHNFPNNRR